MTHTPSDDHKLSRRGLLRGDWIKIVRKKGEALLETEKRGGDTFQIKIPQGTASRGNIHRHRPPHAVPELEFLAGCTKCDACLEACPPHAIFRAPENLEPEVIGTPIIDSLGQPCIMCQDLPCVSACEAGVLNLEAPISMGLAKIDSIACIAYRGTICTTCVEHCPVEDAITMQAGRPNVNADLCTGCGVCIYVCPAPVTGGAIMLIHAEPSS